MLAIELLQITIIHVLDTFTSKSSHVTKSYLFICNTYDLPQATIDLHSTKRRMRYDPGKNVTHGCDLNVKARLSSIRNLIFVVREDF